MHDWAEAGALAVEYVQTECNASPPISFRRFEPLPFLIVTWWTNPDGKDEGARVLIYDGKVQPGRGPTAVASYLEHLTEPRVRNLSITDLETLLEILDATRPSSLLGLWHRDTAHYADLHPMILDADGVRSYVAHFFVVDQLPAGLGGSRAPGPLVLQRWRLDLWPPAHEWRLDGQVERPRPIPKLS